MKIRKLRPSDIKNASSIVENNYSKTYGKRAEKELWAMFKNKVFDPTYFVAEENKKIIGVAGYSQSSMYYTIYEIFWVNVSPISQNKGIGTKLVGRVLKEIKNKKGEDRASVILLTTSKLKFYIKFGFKAIFNLPENNWLMSMKLSK